MIYRRDKKTGQASKRFPVASTVITVAAIITSIYWFATQYHPVKIIQEAKAAEMEVEVIDLKDVPCKVREDGVFDCTSDPSLRARMEVVKTITVNRTKYSRADSCHNPKRVGDKIWCLTAIGRDTVEGVTVACPRDIKLGTRVRFKGTTHVYVCEDRYSTWVDDKRDYPTIDVFAEAPNLAKLPNFQTVELEILR